MAKSTYFGITIFVTLAAILFPHLTSLKPTNVALKPAFNSTAPIAACLALAAVLPDNVYLSHHAAFQDSINSYWSANARELIPGCVVSPSTAEQVALAVKTLKFEFDHNVLESKLKIALRSGGHSPEAGFAGVDGGVLIDMSRFTEITVADDKKSASIGIGARWGAVSSKLEAMGLAVVGGRSSAVGVGGLVLGGGISFFSPQYGMVCDNIDAYQIVLANGTIAQVTSSQHPDLWRALKGGGGNFGIVTNITVKTFVSGKIWSGYAYWPSWQTSKLLKAFAEFNEPVNFDKHASGPLLSACYAQKLRLHLTVCNLAYTKPQAWPKAFRSFQNIWRVWSTTKIQTLTEATDEVGRMSPYGDRQFQVTTTVKNDLGTFEAMRSIFNEHLKRIKNVRGSIWCLVFQPLPAAVPLSDQPGILGFQSRMPEGNLVNVLINVAWLDSKDDELVHRVLREMLDECDAAAVSRGTADSFRYLNYAASGQDPIGSYGELNKHFLQTISKAFDPDGLWQRTRHGGFGLDMYK